MRETVKPALQLELTDAELDEEIPRMLTANNPEAPQNISRFHVKERTFKLEAMVEQCAMHYATDGWLLAKESEEGKKQVEMERLQEEALSKAQAEVSDSAGAAEDDADEAKQLRNQFNFSDRACQTSNAAPKSRGCYTEPPQTTTRSGSCSQWEIYDDYVRDIEAQKIREQRSKKRSSTERKAKNHDGAGQEGSGEIENVEPAMIDGVSSRAAKVVERMTMQNVFDEFGMDLKYWDDNSDTFRPNEASLLPLWRFCSEASSGKQVTSICPHHRHSDVFAVGYGSYEALRQTAGCVSVYSIKNPAVPERDLPLDSGVLTVAFHPEYSTILAAGCYDGGLRVMKTDGEMLYVTDSVTNRPSEAVWQIFWKRDAGVGELQLYSASADGQLGLWTFTRAEILFEPMMIIETQSHPIHRVAGMLALDFNQLEETTYLVGTEGGAIHRCSTEYDSEYLDTYRAHELPVYAAKWNRFHPDIFLTSSEDWTVRLWDAGWPDHALLTFELGAPVTDVAWAPYASTVFAAITATGSVFAYDVTLNRHIAICEQKIVSRGRLTKILFHPQEPLVFIGDAQGIVRSFKLSPNLRKNVLRDVLDANAVQNERDRLQCVLDVALKSVMAHT